MQLQKIMQNENGPATQSTQTETSSAFGGATGSITGVDTFVLDYKVSSSFTEIKSEYFLELYSAIDKRFLKWIPDVVSLGIAILIKVRWPVSLVLSRRALTKYQLIFRHLFHCKHVRRQLCAAWQIHQVCHTSFGSTYYTLRLPDSNSVSLNAGPNIF